MDIPDILQSKSALSRKHLKDIVHPLHMAAERLLYVSDYVGRRVDHLKTLLLEDDCLSKLGLEDYQRLVARISLDQPANAFMQALRHFRHRYLIRLWLRELANCAQTDETIASWSDCADALILYAMLYCERQLVLRYGQPINASGGKADFYFLAMGKLGGRELNFSSDVDLIGVFSEAGYTNGKESISNEEYFSKLVQQVVLFLQNNTADGFVFRVDLRLRPNGDSGPLVSSLAAIETYYQEQGRDWERYAMVKARPISHSGHHQWFFRLMIPFVYRRYVDFSVIESLRSMKGMIEREIKLNPMLDDIKRGRGGIREIEFIIQCFQLTRGGRWPQLQQQNALLALSALKKEGLLAHTAALQQAYLFLRKLENALQIHNDQQTHSLPTDLVKQAQLSMAMDYASWNTLTKQLHQYQRIVSHLFQGVLNKVAGDIYQDEKRLLANQLTSLWQGHIEPSMAINLLMSLDFDHAEHCHQMIHTFRHSPRCRRLSQAARMRLDRFMVILLSELIQVSNTAAVLLQVINLLENIVGRSAYLALLAENPSAMHELLHWFAHSPFISFLLVNQPFLLEILIDQKQTWRPLSKSQLQCWLNKRLSHCVEWEAQDDMLRQFKLTCWLLAARAELYKQCDAVRIGQFLADVAEVIIAEVLARACLQLSVRYPEIMEVKSHFAIVAYGKLGSREMNYDSDVDLVFLHTVKPDKENLVTRLTQKILHMLTTRLQTGILYAVDTRLRPSGSAGLLVSHFDAFKDYQRSNAWTWEHQALLRARVLWGPARIKTNFYQLKTDILFLPRNIHKLCEEVRGMRAKMDEVINRDPIKHNAGGLIDLEFLVQFLVLSHPGIEFVHCTNTLLQLKRLLAKGVMSQVQFMQLKRAYRAYHKALHQQLLQPELKMQVKFWGNVLEICRSLYPSYNLSM